MARLPEELADSLAGMGAALRRRLGLKPARRDRRYAEVLARLDELNSVDQRATAVDDTRFVVIDTETTGFRAYGGDAIVSIALLEMQGTRQTGRRFETMVNPRRPIPAAVTRIHGITDSDVRDAPLLREVLPDILEFMDHGVLVGHHVNFDLRFLNRATLRWLHRRLPHLWIDTMLLFLTASGRLGHYSLEQVAAACQVRVQGRHSATGDAQAAADIFTCMVKKLTDPGETLDALIDRQFDND